MTRRNQIDALRDLPMALRGSTTVHYGNVQFHLSKADGKLYAMKDKCLYVKSPQSNVEQAACDIIVAMSRDGLLT